jgi:hypothetical protein
MLNEAGFEVQTDCGDDNSERFHSWQTNRRLRQTIEPIDALALREAEKGQPPSAKVASGGRAVVAGSHQLLMTECSRQWPKRVIHG